MCPPNTIEKLILKIIRQLPFGVRRGNVWITRALNNGMSQWALRPSAKAACFRARANCMQGSGKLCQAGWACLGAIRRHMRQRDRFTFALPETSLEPILGRPKHRIEANTPQPAQPPAPQRRAFWGSASLSGGGCALAFTKLALCCSKCGSALYTPL